MRTAPSIVPPDNDQDVYLVLDDFGRLGLAWRETDPSDTDYQTIIGDLLDGQYSNPVRVVGFNVAEGWSRDVSEDVAREIVARAFVVPASLEDFVDRYFKRERST